MTPAADAPAPVPSPCTQVCRIDARTSWCAGCRRSLDEIARWRDMDDDERRRVWRRIAARGGLGGSPNGMPAAPPETPPGPDGQPARSTVGPVSSTGS